MKRTIVVCAVLGVAAAVPIPAQDGGAGAAAAPPPRPVDAIVAAMRDAEQRATSFVVELRTTGHLPGDLELSTRGVLHVLRGAQPAVHTAVEFAFGDGLGGRVESAQTADGIVLYEENPAFGELFVRFGPEVVRDLEWAGGVLERADLPGMPDRRATAPLGSAMVTDLQRRFALAPTAVRERAGESGTWLSGPRRAAAGEHDPDLPHADRVELFVRDRDRALVEARWLQGDRLLQHVEVEQLRVDAELPAGTFTVDGRGQRLRDVREHAPMWDQIEQVLKKAEAKAPEGETRPSRR